MSDEARAELADLEAAHRVRVWEKRQAEAEGFANAWRRYREQEKERLEEAEEESKKSCPTCRRWAKSSRFQKCKQVSIVVAISALQLLNMGLDYAYIATTQFRDEGIFALTIAFAVFPVLCNVLFACFIKRSIYTSKERIREVASGAIRRNKSSNVAKALLVGGYTNTTELLWNALTDELELKSLDKNKEQVAEFLNVIIGLIYVVCQDIP